jgi:DNA-binding NarL/FixJ family response regulator
VDILKSYLPQETDTKNGKKTFGLTVRELDVVAAIVSGFTNREIAQKFSISEQTVKHHLRNIFDKVGVSNRLELALFAINHQLVAP